jgi:hypothetical protein
MASSLPPRNRPQPGAGHRTAGLSWGSVIAAGAVALATLEAKQAVPQLLALLDQPEPSLPVLDEKTNKYVVKEMVRLNHFRNCLLCHAPSGGPQDGMVRGAIPVLGKALPVAYDAGAALPADTRFVRADITFLRQDFSIVLPTPDDSPWPAEQRFDFLTRLKEVPAPERVPTKPAPRGPLKGVVAKPAPGGPVEGVAAKPAPPGPLEGVVAKPAPAGPLEGVVAKPGRPEEPEGTATQPQPSYPQREAVLYALRKITGVDGGQESARWRELVGTTARNPSGNR